MHWEDAPFVKLYRDNGPWMDLSLEARGLFDELLKVVDRAGLLKLGADPVKTIARAVNGDPERVSGYLAELTRDGCVTLRDGVLVMKNYIAAQSARASDKSRQAEARARARDSALAITNQQLASENVTHQSRGVTHESRLEENRREENSLAQPSAPRVRFDFDSLYAQYPNKQGKAKGLEKLKALVKTEAEFQAVKHGLGCFLRDEKQKGTETRFYPHFSTWVNQRRWEDYAKGKEAAPTAPSLFPDGMTPHESPATARTLHREAVERGYANHAERMAAEGRA